MKHNVEPITNEYFSCHQILLATYATYQKREYDMIFAESWGFGYQKYDQPFGISLDPYYQNRREELLEKFHCIETRKLEYTDKEDLMESLQSILPYSPVILYCDVFDCPWNISYKRNHIDHYILITGVDDNLMHLFVLDPYSTKDENIIGRDSIISDVGQIDYFVTIPLNNIQDIEYRFEIANSINHIKNSSFFENLNNFRNDFTDRFEEVMYSEYTDIYAIPLIINLRRIANQRHCYCIFLNKMIDKGLIDSSMLKFMENIAEKYSLLRIFLIRQVMKKKHNKECGDIINDIINAEYEAYEKLKLFECQIKERS